MLLFILIIIAIYIIAFKNNNQKEITYNIHPIVSKEKFAPVNYYHPNLKKIRQVLPNGSNLVQLIISEYVDPTYKFNDPNLPVTFRYPKSNRKKIDKKYTKLIKQNIESWNLLFSKYFQSDEQFLFVKNINLISVQETEVEFILSANVMLTYLSKTLHLNLEYYGQVIRSDEFLNGAPPVDYIIQLFKVTPIRKNEYEAKVEFHSDPFLTMGEQLEYVNQINFMHKNEKN